MTCVSAQSTQSALQQLVLVGRSDGTVDLFQMDVSAPLQTWSTDQLLARESSANTAVSLVKWLPNKPTCFVIVDALGNVLLFDLLLDAHSPVCKDKLPAPFPSQRATAGNPGSVALSGSRPGTSSASLAFISDQGHVNVRALWEGWVRAPEVGKEDLQTRLAEQIGHWSLRTANAAPKAIFTSGEGEPQVN